MLVILFFLITVPILEIAIFIQAGGWFGLWPTIFIVIVTAMVGSWLIRQQGRAILYQAQNQINQGKMPMMSLLSGICLLVAGAFLITPGFLTDALGFLLLVPTIRLYFGQWVLRILFSHLRFDVASEGIDPHAAQRETNTKFRTKGRFFDDETAHASGNERANTNDHKDQKKTNATIKPNVVDIDYDAS